jgi:hypothetical protein
MALHPIHVAFKSGNWAVLSDADYAVAAQTNAQVTFADVYKQGSKYAWVQAHGFDAKRCRSTAYCRRTLLALFVRHNFNPNTTPTCLEHGSRCV